MKEVVCRGTSYELGFQHGQGALEEVLGSLAFYQMYFQKSSKMQWEQVVKVVDDFMPYIEANCAEMLEEMRGVADGAKVSLRDVIALNIRTEIAFGLFKPEKETDGCTALAYFPPSGKGNVLLGQNWDWKKDQQPNLIALTLTPDDGRPQIKMVTEGGIIGKIGLNEYGVGACLNAIRAQGVATDRMPIHLALRTALECKTAQEAFTKLKSAGCASAGHILIGGPDAVQGIEFSSIDYQTIDPNEKGYVAHSNHYLLAHPTVYEPAWLVDSPLRYKRALELSDSIDLSKGFTEFVDKVFKDEDGAPCAICRTDPSIEGSLTIFSIAMDLTAKKAVINVGQPIAPTQVIEISFP